MERDGVEWVWNGRRKGGEGPGTICGPRTVDLNGWIGPNRRPWHRGGWVGPYREVEPLQNMLSKSMRLALQCFIQLCELVSCRVVVTSESSRCELLRALMNAVYCD